MSHDIETGGLLSVEQVCGIGTTVSGSSISRVLIRPNRTRSFRDPVPEMWFQI